MGPIIIAEDSLDSVNAFGQFPAYFLNNSLEDLTLFSHWIPPVTRSTELATSGLRGTFSGGLISLFSFLSYPYSTHVRQTVL